VACVWVPYNICLASESWLFLPADFEENQGLAAREDVLPQLCPAWVQGRRWGAGGC